MTHRYEGLINRADELTNRLIAVANGDEPQTIHTSAGEFDNEGWLEAELQATKEERSRLSNLITANGEAIYDEEVER